ncbi:substance-K receptor-like [Penaeus chinensis]|uniref:substance-K receptor-like n=1 Tax=Penaeus chinensis TaxID=139456 RepID=UPI001FB71B90|nr:substance-K receptor-like [Penaeus chinensis]XP_047476219.1 substance-K receptor-like [Penaeus chinensis]
MEEPASYVMTQVLEDPYKSILENLSMQYPHIDWWGPFNITSSNLTDFPFLLDDDDGAAAAAAAGGGRGTGGAGGGLGYMESVGEASNATGGTALLYEVPTSLVVLLSFFYGSISLVAVVGNALVMWVVATSKKMHTVTNYFIANLALADIIIGLFAIPFQFQAALLQRWNLPHFMCSFCPFFQTVSVNVSIFTLTAIAVDRYRAIVHPFTTRPSKLRSKVVIASIWLFSTTLAIPNAIALRVVQVADEATGREKPYCAAVNIDSVVMWTYSHVMVGLQYFLPLGIISFAYIRMGWELWGAQTPGNAEDARDAHVLRNKKKVIKMLSMVVILFAVCWAPLQTYHVLQEIYPAINMYRYINIIWFCCHWLAMSNSCCNPFIYAIYNEKFKREFRLKFRCCFRHFDSLEVFDIEKSKCHYPVGGPEVHLHKDTVLSRPPDLRFNGGSSPSPYVIRTSTSTPLPRSVHEHQHTHEVHVCVPLKSQTRLHPDLHCPKISGDTKM